MVLPKAAVSPSVPETEKINARGGGGEMEGGGGGCRGRGHS